VPVRLPPLAERLDELPSWADYMLRRRHHEAGGEGAVRFEAEAMKLLGSARWPGNLRQLDNIVRRAYALLLAGQPSANGDVVVQRRHVESALMFDGDGEPSDLARLMWRAALGFVREVARQQGGLSLEMIEAFRGMVLGAAVQQTGDRDAAFVLLGQDTLIKNRNHHRTLKRELARVRELVRLLGGSVDPELQAVLDDNEES
jgi:DNA-binding NtrC family response regulator